MEEERRRRKMIEWREMGREVGKAGKAQAWWAAREEGWAWAA